MHARWLMVPLTVAAGAMAAACATPDTTRPEPIASAGTQCKVVTVYNAADVIHNQNARGVPGSSIQRAEGAADAGRIEAANPTRAPVRLDSATAKLSREC